ncbi:MAG: hypothetical protein J6J16_04995 [Lachnospiraceae bacterium]|nr:hypothetical protein [Lachnospiraceae bacterium]
MDNNFNNQDNMSTVQPGVVQPTAPVGGMPQPMAPMSGMPQPMAPNEQTAAPTAPVAPTEQTAPVAPQVPEGAVPPMGQPPMGAPMGQPPMGQAPMGAPMGQPPMGAPMGQPPMGMAPMGAPMGQPPAGKPKKQKAPKVKKPMTGGKIAAIITGSVALVAAIVCAIIFLPKLFKPAKDVVVEAFENTFTISANSEEKQTYMEEVVGISDISKAFYENGGELGMTFALESVMGEAAPYIMSIGVNEKIDYASKLVNVDATFDVDGTNVATMNIIGDETNTYVELQDMIDGYFSLPNENMFIALENSPLGQEMGLYGMPQFTVDYFMTTAAATELDGNYVEAVETLWDAVKVEKEGKAKIDVNGETVKATEYVVTIAKEDLQDSLESILDSLLTPEYIEETAAMSGMSSAELQSSVSMIKGMIPTLINKDFTAKVYVKDKKVVKITSDGKTTLYGVSMSYDFFFDITDEAITSEFVIDLMGEKVVISLDVEDMDTAPTGSFVMSAGGEEVGIDFAWSNDITDSKETMKLDMSMYMGSDDIMSAVANADIDKTNDTFVIDVAMNMSEEYFDMEDMGEIELIFEGSFTDINKGVSYKQIFDNIECIVDGESIVAMSGTYTYNTDGVAVAGIDSSKPVYDLTTMSSDDLVTVIDDNEDLLNEWLDNVENNTGAFGEDIVSMMEEDDYEEPDVEDYDDPVVTMDDAVLYGYMSEVTILNPVDGFTFDYGGFYLEFITENYSYIDYYLYDQDHTVESVLALASMPTEEDGYTIYDSGMNVEAVLSDGSVVYYNYAQFDDYGYTVTFYTMAKEVLPGIILNVDAYIYDDYDTYTAQDIAEALNDNNFNIIVN